ncbi:DUF222 domain-containing protein [Cellulomonas sp. ATA003]|uniref:HNH endonuclease signature motif containing protein n=1 Tax=Cellulomonas sp. ATA003 TaxID=3073064 RepID=UPI002873476D|nr:DUF222 domain-containing protein [Cellulomonas sp. ATA003]WNB87356.1 DUF222 domain-containing protein [Cellulomonas sp. ATA003]
MDPDDVTPAVPRDAGLGGPDLSALPHDVAAAVFALLAATDAVAAAVDTTGLDGAQAAVVAAAVASVTSRLGVAGTRLLPVIEADGLWATGGARSFPRWVAARHRISVRTAQAQVRLGRALRDHLPATAAAGLAGAISGEQVQVIGTFAPTTPQRCEVLADPGNDCNEDFLVAQAKAWPVDSLRIVTRRWAAAADPDADDRGYREAADRAHFTMSRSTDGYHLAGLLTIDAGQCLKSALEALTPAPAAGDHRDPAHRRAQALGDLARVALDGGLSGTRGGVRPHVSVLVPYSVITDAEARAAATDRGPDVGSTDGARGAGDAGNAEAARAATPAGPDAPDAPDEFLTPDAVSGATPLSVPQYQDGTPIPRTALDRLLCDAGFTRFLFSADSQILDVGREKRLFTPQMRAAIIARDRHCRYPGCTSPPVLCECHHVDQWARDHGTTCVTNGILLCWHHHDLIHRMDITITHDGRQWVFTDRHGALITTTRGMWDGSGHDFGG